jgi:type VI secretion system protein ImpG
MESSMQHNGPKKIKEYFEEEMELLNTATTSFSKKYPHLAPALFHSDHEKDPYIERLLEGSAYLNARIRQSFDHKLPDITETLLEQLFPWALQPFPSQTITQFNPNLNKLNAPVLIPKGTVLNTEKKHTEDSATITFITDDATEINPLELLHSTFTNDCLKLSFSISPQIKSSRLSLKKLRLYIHEKPFVAQSIYALLTREIKGIHFEYHSKKRNVVFVRDPIISIKPSFINKPSYSSSSNEAKSYELLQSYFCVPHTFLFLDILGLEPILKNIAPHQFTLIIYFDSKKKNFHSVSNHAFQLHCTPAKNLCSISCEPLHITPLRNEYPLRLDATNCNQLVFSHLNKVTAYDPAQGIETPCLPATHFHKKPDSLQYQLLRHEHLANNENPRLLIKGHEQSNPMIISCQATACDGQIPHQFLTPCHFGIPENLKEQLSSISSLTRPSPMFLPPNLKNYQWQILSHLSYHLSPMSSLEQFKNLLECYDWGGKATTKTLADRLHSLNFIPTTTITRGISQQGAHLQVIFESLDLVNQPEIYLFGDIMNEFLKHYQAMHTTILFSIGSLNQPTILTWK